MLGLGEKFPQFQLDACISLSSGDEFKLVSNKDFENKWAVFFFWPYDFTDVCPTELIEFNNEMRNFQIREACVFGISADSQYVHLAWRKNHPGLKDIQYPMLSDYMKSLCGTLGILSKDTGAPLRATYIVDPQGIIRWVSVNDLSVGRNIKDILRNLDALQTDELCPCNWEKGQKTLGK